MKIHLMDGTYELFRAYYSPGPGRLSPSGQEVGATQQLFRSMLKQLREPDTTHMAVAFDTVIESFRNDLFEGYKTGEGIETALSDQFLLAEQAIRALGVAVWPMIEFEADDALATGAHLYSADPTVEQVVLCSPDKDLAQCVSGSAIVCLDRRREKVLDEAGVVEKFGVSPRSIPDYLALVGDSADGIPGIPRWGAKGAAAVLSRYHRLEDIPDDPNAWDIKVRGAKTLAHNLAERRADAMLYRRLAILRTDVPIAESAEDLRWQGARRAEVERLCRETGMRTAILDQIPAWQP
jgi:5'-3' exonuclease